MITITAVVSLVFSGSFAWSSLGDFCEGIESHDARWRTLLAQLLFFIGSFCGMLTALYALLARWL